MIIETRFALKAGLLSTFCAFAVCCALFTAAAPIFAQDSDFRLSPDGKTLSTFIGGGEEARVPDGVETIKRAAFKRGRTFGVPELKKIVLPKSVVSFGDEAFDAAALEAIEVAEDSATFRSIDGVLYSKDGKTLFRYPSGKVGGAYYIPSCVETIAPNAFLSCSFLRAIVVPNGVKSIGESAFQSSALESLALPASVEKIADATVFDYAKIRSVYVDENNANYRSIDGVLYSKDAKTLLFYPGENERTRFVVPEAVERFEACPTKYCRNLTSLDVSEGNLSFRSDDGVLFSRDGTVLVAYPAGNQRVSYVVPDGVKKIGRFAFASAWRIESIELPEGVETIDEEAFYNCFGLKSIVVPKTVKEIAPDAFNACSRELKIRASDDSYAKKYATDSKIPFESIE
ncbi:MAG: leucine-rich repeat domain-containing protein [Thermoguttaceae bacterium]|nr:leucine-rich repeat domain-containing protein [Thermoguttaceae bacterium]